jgi:hypothetical protein
MYKEREDTAALFTRIIQEFVLCKEKNSGGNSQAALNNYNRFVDPFYELLMRKAESLRYLNTTPSAIEALSSDSVVYDQKFGQIKKVSMEHSMSFFSDITVQIIVLIDNNILENNEVLFNKIRDLMLELINGFEKVQLNELKQRIHSVYLNDLIFAINKSLQFILKMLSRGRPGRAQTAYGMVPMRGGIQTPLEILEKLSKIIEDKTRKCKDLMKILNHLMENCGENNAKQMHDCYMNIQSFSSFYPDLLLDCFKEVFGNKVFRSNRSTWSSNDFNNIYVGYITALKNLISANSPDNGQVQNYVSKLKFPQFNSLIDNLIHIIYDNRTYPNYIVKSLDELKLLIEMFKKDASSENPGISRELLQGGGKDVEYLKFLTRILQKMVMQLKITRNMLDELMKYLNSIEMKDLTEKTSKTLDDTIFKELPRYEECQNDEELQLKLDQFLDKIGPQLNDDSIFYSYNNQRTKIGPLLEDREGFVMNSYPINNGSTKIGIFIEENIFKKILVLNEICSILFTEIITISESKTRRQDTVNMNVPGGRRTINQVLDENEYYLLKKMYKYNLKIYAILSQDQKHANIKDCIEYFKFDCNIFERTDKDNTLIKLDQRQIYMMIEENLPTILIILKNLAKTGEAYPSVPSFHPALPDLLRLLRRLRHPA